MKGAYIILLMAFILSGCKSSKQTETTNVSQNTQQFDSIFLHETETVTPVTVPESKVSIILHYDDMESLPEGAAYSGKSGQATVMFKKTKDAYEVSANCDSLWMLLGQSKTEIYRLERQNHEFSEKLEKKEIETIVIKEPSPFQWFQVYGFRILLTVILIVFIFKKFSLWQKILNPLKKIFR